MEAAPYYIVAAATPDMLIWIIVLIGWGLVQMLTKAARGKKPPPEDTEAPPPPSAPPKDLGDFLADMMKQIPEAAPSISTSESATAVPPRPTTLKKPKPAAKTAPAVPAPAVLEASAAAMPETPAARPVPKADSLLTRELPPMRGIRHIQPLIMPMPAFSPARKKTPPAPLVAAIKNPTTCRQAVLFREIMGPPKGLRLTQGYWE